jgi:cytosine deaminase
MLYTNLRDAAGATVAVRCEEGRIADIGDLSGQGLGGQVQDGGGRLLMPAFVEPHVHLDKTLYGEPWRACTAGPTLRDYIDNERRVLAAQTTPIAVRAGRLVERMLCYGTTAIRSHVDVAPDIGLAHVEALLALRETWRDLIDMQFVAFPQTGLLCRPGTTDLMREAMRMGVETVGGLDPAGIDGDPDVQLRFIFALAEEFGAGLDIHLHDKGELGAWQVERIADYTQGAGLGGRVMISHAYCLGMVSQARLAGIGRRLADLGISLMTSAPAETPIPPVEALTQMGVTVCCGSDGIRDAWSPVGNGDMLERAFFTAYKYDWCREAEFALALDCATGQAARAIGLADYGLHVGARADFLMVDAETPGDALCRRPAQRRVVRAGRVVAEDGRML